VSSAATAADIPVVPATIAALPFFAAGRFPKPDLVGRCRAGGIDATSSREFLDAVRDISLGLTALGLAPGDRVALLSESRPEWLLTDLAVLMAGAVVVPVYPTLAPEQVEFIVRDSGATWMAVSTPVHAAVAQDVAQRVPALRHIVVFDGPGDEAARVPVTPLPDITAHGHRQIVGGWGIAHEFQERVKRIGPDDLATLIYTSGTTGEPKGVMLTHGNLVANLKGILAVLPLSSEDIALSFLPLSHAFERMVVYVYLTSGISAIFAESPDTVARDLLAVRPTVMTAVPRVFEKLEARVMEKGLAGSVVKRAIFRWATGVARARGARAAHRGPLPARLRWASSVADRLVFAKVRAGVGGRLRFAVSGSAALRPDIARFFYGVGLPVLEGYGLTEASPVLSVTPLEEVRFGTVGPPLPNVELRTADDGEVLARGPNIMRGYYNRPDETAQVLRDGWLHTGDLGEFDARGFLKLTGRKKELLVTSGGKKIAPQAIEDRLRSHALVGEALLVGDGRHFPAALIVPDFAALARQLGIDHETARTRVDSSDVAALYQRVIDSVNLHLAQFERIKKFAVLPDEFTVATGELTPTLKTRRGVVEAKYRAIIERLYLA
jgi:long-chain acyl-CoA synthetase